MYTADKYTALQNVRLLTPMDTGENWNLADPLLFRGELVIVSDTGRIKIGKGKRYSETQYFGMDRWNIDTSLLPQANDENIRPSGAISKNVEDFLNINGELVYPITLTSSVRLVDGSPLADWMQNIDNGNVIASKLKTPIKIGNASFDGSADITLSQIGIVSAPLVYKNISISSAAWNTSTKQFIFSNADITANHSPDVRFAKDSISQAGLANIIVFTEAGKLIFEYTTLPTVDLIVDVAILTLV